MWPRVLSIATGIWLMAAPAVLGYDDPARAVDRVLGPLAASAAIVALADAVRGLRWLEVACGAALVAVPWVLDHSAVATLNSVACGAVLIAAGASGGRVASRLGGGWAAVLRGR